MASFGSHAASVAAWSRERVAAVAFGVYLALAIPVLLRLGSHYWFKGDEWALLAGGDVLDPAVLFQSLQSHWSTFPILVYRTLYNIFGLHSYLPFQLCLILLHLTLCCLLRVIMRRVGVGPWIASITAGAFVLFGAGETNILSGVQISQVGSIVFGFAHLLLSDHDGRIDRRDWLGLLCGLMSIMSSGIGPPLVAIVGIAVICRRGWRPALFHTLILASVYVAWWLSNHALGEQAGKAYPALWFIVRWVVHGWGGVFLALGGYTVVAVALGVLLLAGLILAWRPLSLSALRQRASLPAAMLLGAAALLAVICLQRWQFGLDAARADRYLSACTALTLPALAVAADALARRWHWMMPVFCVLVLVGIGVNITRFGNIPSRSPDIFIHSRAALLAVAYSPLAEQAPADLMPEPHGIVGGDVDMAFLLAARDSGRLPPPPTMTPALQSRTELRLSVRQIARPESGPRHCIDYTGPVELYPAVGEVYEFTTPVRISLGESDASLAYNDGWGYLPAIRVLRPGLRLRFSPRAPRTGFGLCQRANTEGDL